MARLKLPERQKFNSICTKQSLKNKNKMHKDEKFPKNSAVEKPLLLSKAAYVELFGESDDDVKDEGFYGFNEEHKDNNSMSFIQNSRKSCRKSEVHLTQTNESNPYRKCYLSYRKDGKRTRMTVIAKKQTWTSPLSSPKTTDAPSKGFDQPKKVSITTKAAKTILSKACKTKINKNLSNPSHPLKSTVKMKENFRRPMRKPKSTFKADFVYDHLTGKKRKYNTICDNSSREKERNIKTEQLEENLEQIPKKNKADNIFPVRVQMNWEKCDPVEKISETKNVSAVKEENEIIKCGVTQPISCLSGKKKVKIKNASQTDFEGSLVKKATYSDLMMNDRCNNDQILDIDLTDKNAVIANIEDRNFIETTTTKLDFANKGNKSIFKFGTKNSSSTKPKEHVTIDESILPDLSDSSQNEEMKLIVDNSKTSEKDKSNDSIKLQSSKKKKKYRKNSRRLNTLKLKAVKLHGEVCFVNEHYNLISFCGECINCKKTNDCGVCRHCRCDRHKNRLLPCWNRRCTNPLVGNVISKWKIKLNNHRNATKTDAQNVFNELQRNDVRDAETSKRVQRRSTSPRKSSENLEVSFIGDATQPNCGVGEQDAKLEFQIAKHQKVKLLKKNGSLSNSLEVFTGSLSPIRPKLRSTLNDLIKRKVEDEMLLPRVEYGQDTLVKLPWPNDSHEDAAWLCGYHLCFTVPTDRHMTNFCFLCGSAGKSKMSTCSYCCESFHPFCLEVEPLDELNWCCDRCKRCLVCGLKENLLMCDKCHDCYHAECLGPFYQRDTVGVEETWICGRCVKCVKCERRTAGPTKSSKWSYNFSMCEDCGSNWRRGNYCPICTKLYQEDDDSLKMMFCSNCEKWIHMDCEGISVDEYEILAELPENIPYVCKLCFGDEKSKAVWYREIHEELINRFVKVYYLITSDSSFKTLKNKLSNSTATSFDQFEVLFGTLERKDFMRVGDFFVVVMEALESLRMNLKESSSLGTSMLSPSGADNLTDLFQEVMCKLFPWFSSTRQPVDDSKETQPIVVLPKFPSIAREENISLNHDHIYIKTSGKASQETYETGDNKESKDLRRCLFCSQCGDDIEHSAGRLLYAGLNEWVHVNCALWSAEVYEDDEGRLQHVHDAFKRGSKLKCERCGRWGATIGCCVLKCSKSYHFTCAKKSKAVFLDDKKIYCTNHMSKANKNLILAEKELAVRRRVLVDLTRFKSLRRVQRGLDPSSVNLWCGTLSLHTLGTLNEKSDVKKALIPLGYKVTRIFWSTRTPMRKCTYTCEVKVSLDEEKVVDDTNNHTMENESCEDHNTTYCHDEEEWEKTHTECYCHVLANGKGVKRKIGFDKKCRTCEEIKKNTFMKHSDFLSMWKSTNSLLKSPNEDDHNFYTKITDKIISAKREELKSARVKPAVCKSFIRTPRDDVASPDVCGADTQLLLDKDKGLPNNSFTGDHNAFVPLNPDENLVANLSSSSTDTAEESSCELSDSSQHGFLNEETHKNKKYNYGCKTCDKSPRVVSGDLEKSVRNVLIESPLPKSSPRKHNNDLKTFNKELWATPTNDVNLATTLTGTYVGKLAVFEKNPSDVCVNSTGISICSESSRQSPAAFTNLNNTILPKYGVDMSQEFILFKNRSTSIFNGSLQDSGKPPRNTITTKLCNKEFCCIGQPHIHRERHVSDHQQVFSTQSPASRLSNSNIYNLSQAASSFKNLKVQVQRISEAGTSNILSESGTLNMPIVDGANKSTENHFLKPCKGSVTDSQNIVKIQTLRKDYENKLPNNYLDGVLLKSFQNHSSGCIAENTNNSMKLNLPRESVPAKSLYINGFSTGLLPVKAFNTKPDVPLNTLNIVDFASKIPPSNDTLHRVPYRSSNLPLTASPFSRSSTLTISLPLTSMATPSISKSNFRQHITGGILGNKGAVLVQKIPILPGPPVSFGFRQDDVHLRNATPPAFYQVVNKQNNTISTGSTVLFQQPLKPISVSRKINGRVLFPQECNAFVNPPPLITRDVPTSLQDNLYPVKPVFLSDINKSMHDYFGELRKKVSSFRSWDISVRAGSTPNKIDRSSKREVLFSQLREYLYKNPDVIKVVGMMSPMKCSAANIPIVNLSESKNSENLVCYSAKLPAHLWSELITAGIANNDIQEIIRETKQQERITINRSSEAQSRSSLPKNGINFDAAKPQLFCTSNSPSVFTYGCNLLNPLNKAELVNFNDESRTTANDHRLSAEYHCSKEVSVSSPVVELLFRQPNQQKVQSPAKTISQTPFVDHSRSFVLDSQSNNQKTTFLNLHSTVIDASKIYREHFKEQSSAPAPQPKRKYRKRIKVVSEENDACKDGISDLPKSCKDSSEQPLTNLEVLHSKSPGPVIHKRKKILSTTNLDSEDIFYDVSMLDDNIAGDSSVQSTIEISCNGNIAQQKKKPNGRACPNQSTKQRKCSKLKKDYSRALLKFLSEEEEERRKQSQTSLTFVFKSSDGWYAEGGSLEVIWRQLVQEINDLRMNNNMKPLYMDVNDSYDFLGLSREYMCYLIEQLPGGHKCKNHKFQHHLPCFKEDDKDLVPNSHGCARAEAGVSNAEKDMFAWLASPYRLPPERQYYFNDEEAFGTGQDFPLAMKYRLLKSTARDHVGVFRSKIQGRGLFCKKPIEAGEMIIEYSGQKVRASLTDRREEYYDKKGIGCYMFRIDDMDVLDATMTGNAARFINHSCDPNCFSKIVTIDGRKKIVIFAHRRICVGEELTYDYNFSPEDDKLPCFCGSKKCRKYLN